MRKKRKRILLSLESPFHSFSVHSKVLSTAISDIVIFGSFHIHVLPYSRLSPFLSILHKNLGNKFADNRAATAIPPRGNRPKFIWHPCKWHVQTGLRESCRSSGERTQNGDNSNWLNLSLTNVNSIGKRENLHCCGQPDRYIDISS